MPGIGGGKTVGLFGLGVVADGTPVVGMGGGTDGFFIGLGIFCGLGPVVVGTLIIFGGVDKARTWAMLGDLKEATEDESGDGVSAVGGGPSGRGGDLTSVASGLESPLSLALPLALPLLAWEIPLFVRGPARVV
eukprot:102739-Amorphochlora_amoeboformis.AAC.2